MTLPEVVAETDLSESLPEWRTRISDYLQSSPTSVSFIAGGVAGAVSRTLVSPLERMKILFQIQGPGSESYTGVWSTLVKMWKEEGWRGFMRGNGTNCIRIVPYSACQFAAYTTYKRMLMPKGATELTTPRRLTAGALAGITSVVMTYPLDITRTRLSVQSSSIASLRPPSSKASSSIPTSTTTSASPTTPAGKRQPPKLPGLFPTIVHIYRTEGGIVALYRGIVPTVMGVAPYVGLNFAVYEHARKVVTPKGQKDPTAIGKLVAGGISGAVAQTLTYPMDVLRRRFQVKEMSASMEGYDSVRGAVRKMWAEEGIRGFYKGLYPNLLKVAPSMAASWLTFEFIRDLLLEL